MFHTNIHSQTNSKAPSMNPYSLDQTSHNYPVSSHAAEFWPGFMLQCTPAIGQVQYSGYQMGAVLMTAHP